MSAELFDATDMPYAGSSVIVGPDRRVWTFSSNPTIHDPELIVGVLVRLYEERLSAVVSVELLSERVAAVTSERLRHVGEIVNAAAAGELRSLSKRSLP